MFVGPKIKLIFVANLARANANLAQCMLLILCNYCCAKIALAHIKGFCKATLILTFLPKSLLWERRDLVKEPQ